MKKLIRILLAIGVIAVILCIWECAGSPYLGMGVRTPFESAAKYHLRMMSYHGRETKNGQDHVHGEQLVALGEQAVPVLAEAVGWGFNPRFDPKPHEMLAHFPAAAHHELARRIHASKESTQDSEKVPRKWILFERINLTTTLILISNDWSYLDAWLADVQEQGSDTFSEDNAPRMMRDMLHALLENESAPEPFKSIDLSGAVVINPEFLKWWQENGRRIAAAASREGFHNAKGWDLRAI